MARSFNGTSDYLQGASPISTAFSTINLTMACWAKANSFPSSSVLMGIGQSTTANSNYGLGMATGGVARATAGAQVFTTTATVSTGVWFHAALIGNDSSRSLFLDGGGKTTQNTATLITATPDIFRVSSRARSGTPPIGPFPGSIAECGLWDVILTDDEIASLAAGVCPLLVRLESLVAYWPLIGRNSPETDSVGGFDLTLTGTSQAEHPRILYPTSRRTIFVPAAAAAFDPANGFPWLSSPLPQRPLIEVVPY